MTAGAVCAGIGVLVLAGWHLHLPGLVQVRPYLSPVQYNTAISLIACAVALFALASEHRHISMTAAAVVFAISLLTGSQYVFGIDLHIDTLLFKPYLQLVPAHPGRPAPNTALALLMGSLSLLLLASRTRWRRKLALAGSLSAFVAAVAAVSAAGYLTSVVGAYRWGGERPMAVLTVLALLALGGGSLRVAWAQSEREQAGWPPWLPLAVAVGFGTASVLLWLALEVHRHAQLLSIGHQPGWWAPQASLLLALLATAGVAYSVHLAGSARRQSRQLAAMNFLLAQQIEQRKRAQEALAHKNRALTLVCECNQALVHASDENELLQRICDLAVSVGGYRLAWVGYAEHDEAKSVRIVAQAGLATAYVQPGFVSWGDEERGRGPTGTTIRSCLPCVCHEVLQEPFFGPWRERAVQHGFRSCIALPLIASQVSGSRFQVSGPGTCHLIPETCSAFGAVSIYAAEPQAFDEAEIALLQELVNDLAFGIGALRTRAEHQQAEQQLRTASRYARNLIEASLDPLVTISKDGKIMDVNRATEEVTGAARNDLVGSDFSEYFTEPEKARAGYQQVFAQGFVRDYPLAIRHASGRVTEVLYNAVLFRNDAGEIEGVFAAARDVTALRQAEQQSRTASLYARSLIEASLDPLVTISKDGKIMDVNRATEEVTGAARHHLIGRDFCDYFTEPEKARHGYQQVFAQGFMRDYPLAIRDRSGRTTEVLYNASVFRDEAGQIEGVFAAARDITERKRAEQALEQYAAELKRSNAELQDFAYIASHDLQEPLRKISAFGDRLREHCAAGLDETGRDYLARMLNASTRMAALIDGLLQYSRVSTRAEPLATVDLMQIAFEVVVDLEERIRACGAGVEVEVLPKVRADRTQMRQLLQNLIGNALKFRRPGEAPRVRVSARQVEGFRSQVSGPGACHLTPGACWELAVQDNGIGLDEMYVSRLFRPFQRLHGRAQYEGSGMGLAICRKIAERHGGTISVRSRPGQGSTFLVRLPGLSPQSPVLSRNRVLAGCDRSLTMRDSRRRNSAVMLADDWRLTTRKEERMRRTRGEPVRILLAEDDDDDFLLTQQALKENHVLNTLERVVDGVELMDFLHWRGQFAARRSQQQPALILLDLNMPRKDGREALREIKSDPALRKLPVVVLTTSRAEEDVVRSYELGVNSFISKPVTFPGLVSAMKVLGDYWFQIVELPR